MPIAGHLCDLLGSQRLMLAGALGVAALAFPFFWLLNSGSPLYIWAGLILATGVIAPTMLAASGSFLARQFPTEVRVSGLGTGREVGGAFSGGLVPLAALTIVTISDTHATWGVSLIFLAGAALIAGGSMFDQSRSVASRIVIERVPSKHPRPQHRHPAHPVPAHSESDPHGAVP